MCCLEVKSKEWAWLACSTTSKEEQLRLLRSTYGTPMLTVINIYKAVRAYSTLDRTSRVREKIKTEFKGTEAGRLRG